MVGGLQLIASGAIGRWMAFSQDLAYMVTTVATSTKYQPMEFAIEVLCTMALVNMDDSLDKEENYFSYSVDRARLLGVLSKVVDSIMLNVVNAGHTLGDIPEELRSLCIHLADAPELARIFLKVSRSKTDILLLCDRFQGDILLWILAHFEGSVEVSVAGKQVFQRAASYGGRQFTMIVKTICQEENCRSTVHRIELLELLGEQWTRILDGQDDYTRSPSTIHPLPLYAIETAGEPEQRGILNRESLYNIRNLAQGIIAWVLDVPLRINYNYKFVGFVADLSPKPANVGLRIGDILFRWPRLLNSSEGSTDKEPPIVFRPLKPRVYSDPDSFYGPPFLPTPLLCECFPALVGLLEDASRRCKCYACRHGETIDRCKMGCHREGIFTHLLMLIGNAIADGFGVQEASGITDLKDYTNEVRKLLSELVQGDMLWDSWFNVAASTALGYSSKAVVRVTYEDEGANAFVAVQNGSKVVAATWLDITRKIRPQQCFALESAEGQLPGIEQQCAFVRSEIKMELKCDLDKARRCLPDDSQETLLREISEKDTSEVTIKHALFGSQSLNSCRLVTIISTKSSQRIIDPTHVLVSATRSYFTGSARRPCSHPGGSVLVECGDTENSAGAVYIWSFDNLVANWDDENHGIFYTKSLDSELKVNTALSLSFGGCLIKETSACLLCAREALRRCGICQRIISYEPDVHALTKYMAA
ncbi:hypothetical protein GP486_007873 [Trichoglossum hirsutum]|uniref:Uncharacterized protein n=1 Tax=Trichoglossum hirsutum TaxID=265104 RepID=A0A9P8L4J7_9PEZI|nr:hypothetical protein GP486_007873 [Trichoglossum hirsutum]